jgi:hypothetical protein
MTLFALTSDDWATSWVRPSFANMGKSFSTWLRE